MKRPGDWPGAQSVEALVKGRALEGLWWNRTLEYAARMSGTRFHRLDFASRELVRLVPLPCWQRLTEKRYRGRMLEIVTQIEVETVARHAREGTRPLGARAVLAQHPHETPVKMKKAWAPAFHAATKVARRELLDAYGRFLNAYRVAAARLRDGHLKPGFPEGSFPPSLPFVGWMPESAPG